MAIKTSVGILTKVGRSEALSLERQRLLEARAESMLNVYKPKRQKKNGMGLEILIKSFEVSRKRSLKEASLERGVKKNKPRCKT